MNRATTALAIAALMVEVDPVAVPTNGHATYDRILRMKRLQCLWMARRHFLKPSIDGQHHVRITALAGAWNLDPHRVRGELRCLSTDLSNAATLITFFQLYERRLEGQVIPPSYVYLRRRALIDFCNLIKPNSPLHIAAQSIALNQEHP